MTRQHITEEEAAKELAENIDTVQQCEGVQSAEQLSQIILAYLQTVNLE